MPKLSHEEIEIMLNDDDGQETVTRTRENSHKLEVKRRLDNYFEHKRFKKDFGYEYFD